jgi:hypothetical protein
MSIGILALYIIHSEMNGNSTTPFGRKNRQGAPHDTPRPPSRSSLVVSPWCVVDDISSVTTCISDIDNNSIILEEVEGVDSNSLRGSPTPESPQSIWGRILTPVFGG